MQLLAEDAVTRMELSLLVGSDPIAGELRLKGGPSWSFVGWVALARLIDQALSAAAEGAR